MTLHQRITLALLAAIAAAGIICFWAWCGGFDFNHRDDMVFMLAMVSTIAAVGAFVAVILNTGPES